MDVRSRHEKKKCLMILRNFVWQNVGDGKCSSEGKGPQKTGAHGRSEGKGPQVGH